MTARAALVDQPAEGKETGAPLTGRPLGERLSWITGQVAQIEATGHNQFSKLALSVEDVEDALRPLFAAAGVVALWSCTGHETAPDKGAAWLLKFHVTIYADDNPDDKIEADWFDIGSNPTAAQSFAVKGFYRRLFHLASAEDEAAGGAVQAGRAPSRASNAPAPPAEGRAPGDPGALSNRMADEVEYLHHLGTSLPKPGTVEQVDQEIAAYGMAKVRTRLRAAHLAQCGLTCAHLEVVKAL